MGLPLDPKLAESLIRKLISMADSMMQQNLTPILLCGPELRRYLKTFTRRSVPRLAVLSVNEIPTNMDLKSFGVVSTE